MIDSSTAKSRSSPPKTYRADADLNLLERHLQRLQQKITRLQKKIMEYKMPSAIPSFFKSPVRVFKSRVLGIKDPQKEAARQQKAAREKAAREKAARDIQKIVRGRRARQQKAARDKELEDDQLFFSKSTEKKARLRERARERERRALEAAERAVRKAENERTSGTSAFRSARSRPSRS